MKINIMTIKKEIDRNNDLKLWKYIDFTKFLSLLDSNSLYFARADQLLDSYEGTYPLTDHRKIRRQVYLNSWHRSDYESAAMWEQYAQKNEGLAIVSTFKKLNDAFRKNVDYKIHFKHVKYIDYSNIKKPSTDPVKPFAYKRKSFEHEKEVRAIIHCVEKKNNKEKGVLVPIGINKIIDKIYVAPYAEDWIVDLVNNLIEKYELNVPVIKSRLYDNAQELGI